MYERPMKVGLVTFFFLPWPSLHIVQRLRQAVIFIHPTIPQSVAARTGYIIITIPGAAAPFRRRASFLSSPPTLPRSEHASRRQPPYSSADTGDNTTTRLHAASQVLRDSVCLPPHHNTSRPHDLPLPLPLSSLHSSRLVLVCLSAHSLTHPPTLAPLPPPVNIISSQQSATYQQ